MTEMKQDTNKWFIAVIVVMLALVEVLDMTIVSVALQDMKGALSAAPDQITWTITVYVVSAAIVMPMTGLLSARFGRKQLLVISAIGFTASSFMCGLSQTLWQMILFRGMQGIFGALLPPLAQATLVDTFSQKDLPKAMAIYGIGLMVGPILGPVLGGILTDHLGWRFIFYVNVPIGLVGAVLAYTFLPSTPKVERKLDYWGVLLLALSVGSLQFVLDKGNDDKWFNSNLILCATLLSIIAFMIFMAKGFRDPDNVIRFRIFKDRNFTLGCASMFLYCCVFLGTLSWLPLMLELFLNYPAQTAGLAIMPRGVACLIVIALTPKLATRFDARYLVALAAVLYSIGTLILARFNLNQDLDTLFWPNIFQGLATGFFFVPLNNLTYQSMPKEYSNEATGLLNFFRSLGSSVGVAIFSTLMTRGAQVGWHNLGQNISIMNPALHLWAQQAHMNLKDPQTLAVLGNIINNQAYAMAFVHANQIFSILMLALIPVVLCMTPKRAGKGESLVAE